MKAKGKRSASKRSGGGRVYFLAADGPGNPPDGQSFQEETRLNRREYLMLREYLATIRVSNDQRFVRFVRELAKHYTAVMQELAAEGKAA